MSGATLVCYSLPFVNDQRMYNIVRSGSIEDRHLQNTYPFDPYVEWQMKENWRATRCRAKVDNVTWIF